METTQKTLSKRALAIEPSITMQISALAAELRKKGEPVIGFGAGEPDFDTPEAIKKAGILAIQTGKNKYTAASGIIELKEAISAKIARDQDFKTSSNQIVVSCGAKHSVYNVLAALVDEGDEVIIPVPYWVSYPDQTRLVGGVPVTIPTSDKTHFKITAQQLEQHITEKTKLLILNSPSNPSGMLYTKAELEAIAEVVLKYGIYVLSDEIYEELVYDAATHFSIASLGDAIREKTVLVNGVSKAYAMTGWRIGYTVSTPEIAKAMSNMQSHMTSNPTTNAQWAAVEALNGPQDEVARMAGTFAIRRQLMVEKLNAMNGISCLAPEGAFYAFPNISATFGKRSPSGPISDSVSFCERLLTDAKIACVPGAGFGADDYMRLSYATSEKNIEEGLDRIAAWLDTLT